MIQKKNVSRRAGGAEDANVRGRHFSTDRHKVMVVCVKIGQNNIKTYG